jgi:hypothetical protein
VIYNADPGSLIGEDLFVLPYDYADVVVMTDADLFAYETNAANGCTLPMRSKKRPSNHWKAPFVTGHTYYLRWSYGLDFEKIRMEI